MFKTRLIALLLLAISVGIGYLAYSSETRPYHLGLDVSGGTHLVFRADTSAVAKSEINGAMSALADVVNRRVNVFGVSEPLIQVETGGTVGNEEHRLIVELSGITDVTEAVKMIGRTPVLEFKLFRPDVEKFTTEEMKTKTVDDIFFPAELTGRFLKHAQVNFDPTTYQPIVSIEWNDEGAKLFGKITGQNIGKQLAIFLDGAMISSPTIQSKISSGSAQITGRFTLDEAKKLVQDLNFGALPLPVTLISTQTVGATLGAEALDASVKAGLIAFLIVGLFLILWYRLPGVIATIALAVYVALNLAIFKYLPVTLTAAGIAGFILSLGMAVDANVLIFERMKEELRRGRALHDAVKEGFHRAWLSIRDSNSSSIITGVILYYFASTPVVRGFALVFVIGVLVSMFTAVTLTRTFLMAIELKGEGKLSKFLFSSGFLSSSPKN